MPSSRRQQITNYQSLSIQSLLTIYQLFFLHPEITIGEVGSKEEAPTFGIPVLVLREVTERPEGVAAGTLKLVGTETSHIVRETRRLLDDPSAYAGMAKAVNPFGDGRAAERILEALLESSR